MEQNQQQSQQQQWQGPERRQSMGHYQGEERRRQPQVQEPSPDDGTRPRQAHDQSDIH